MELFRVLTKCCHFNRYYSNVMKNSWQWSIRFKIMNLVIYEVQKVDDHCSRHYTDTEDTNQRKHIKSLNANCYVEFLEWKYHFVLGLRANSTVRCHLDTTYIFLYDPPDAKSEMHYWIKMIYLTCHFH